MSDPTLPYPDPDAVAVPRAPDPSATVEHTVVQQLDDAIAARAPGAAPPPPAPPPTVEPPVVQPLDAPAAPRARGAGPPLADGYRMVRKLGEGTYGTVWLAEDRAGVRVAVKFFAHGTGGQWQMLQD